MGFLRQEFWSGLPFPFPGDLPHQGLDPHFLHWQVNSLPLSHPGNRVIVLLGAVTRSLVHKGLLRHWWFCLFCYCIGRLNLWQCIELYSSDLYMSLYTCYASIKRRWAEVRTQRFPKFASHQIKSDFKKFFYLCIIYLLIFGCWGSSLLHTVFFYLQGLLSSCSLQDSHCGGFFCCRVQ